MDVRSVPGEGSRFRVRVPGSAEPQRSAPLSHAAVDADLRGRRILLVEDNEVIRLVVSELLAQDGVEVREAIDAATASLAIATGRFDAILMDIGLPDRSGLSVIRELRVAERGRARTPVIALTAYAYDEDIARSLDAGADLLLSKPVQHASLRAALSRLLSDRPAAPTAARPR
ncbi:MAG: response regulator [Myxococcales bacterium]|nr:response regulator [Myxococcales bacterium]